MQAPLELKWVARHATQFVVGSLVLSRHKVQLLESVQEKQKGIESVHK